MLIIIRPMVLTVHPTFHYQKGKRRGTWGPSEGVSDFEMYFLCLKREKKYEFWPFESVCVAVLVEILGISRAYSTN